MARRGNLFTVSENHSVREAVIVFILTSGIQNIESYKDLIKPGGCLNEYFQVYDKIKLSSSSIIVKQNNKTEIEQSIQKGFKLSALREGKVTEVFQFLPEKNISSFTYNTISYQSWKKFLDSSIKIFRTIGNYDEGLEVQAIGVMYIDEFYFKNSSSYNPKEIFDNKSKYIPNSILNSDFADFNLNTHHKHTNTKREYIENIGIKIFDEENLKKIRINGSVMIPVPKYTINDYLNSKIGDTEDILNFGHDQNKNLLIDILSESAQQLIGIV